MKMEQVKKESIKRDYLSITDFSNGYLSRFYQKHGITVDELLDAIS